MAWFVDGRSPSELAGPGFLNQLFDPIKTFQLFFDQIYHAYIKDPNAPEDEDEEETADSLAPPPHISDTNGTAFW